MAITAGSCASTEAETVDVFAASSLTSALAEIVEVYETEHPDTEVRLTFAGSSALREQLRDGAEADIFISANDAIVASLVADGTLAGGGTVIASNELVLAVPTDNSAGVDGLDDLADSDLLVGLCAEGVPCGDLARQLLVDRGVEPSLDLEASDVRSLALRLADAELDAALVYRSDVVALHDQLEIIGIGATVSNRYPLVVLDETEPAVGLARFIAAPAGQQILSEWGFGPS